MEKYSQFRDRGTYIHAYPQCMHQPCHGLEGNTKSTGSGIAPFFPIPTQPSGVALPFHLFLFTVRVAIVVPFSLLYFLILSWLPLGALGKKAALWVILGVPGVWWIDLAVDGVKKGYVHPSQPHISIFTNTAQLPRPPQGSSTP